MFRPLRWLAKLGNALLAEIPPPKSQRISPNLITPEQSLSPTEKEIIARAEESFRLIETRSQAVLERIRETPVISPAPAPVKLVKVPEILEVSAPAPITEFLEVPEVPEIPEILATVEPLQNEEPAPEGWAVIEVGTEQPSAASPAKINRKQLVEGLLDEAWQQGLRTYAQLMKYVELQTGKSCSKRVVSAWKQSRQLDQVAA